LITDADLYPDPALFFSEFQEVPVPVKKRKFFLTSLFVHHLPKAHLHDFKETVTSYKEVTKLEITVFLKIFAE
jgi:hypothetical protein